MVEAAQYWITVVELETFTKEARDLFSRDEIEGLIAFVANHPDEGKVIPGTGGVRKLRWRARGKGKSSGARVIYFFRDLNMPLYLLTVYGKGEKIDLSMGERNAIRKLVEQIVREQWSNQVVTRIVRLEPSRA